MRGLRRSARQRKENAKYSGKRSKEHNLDTDKGKIPELKTCRLCGKKGDNYLPIFGEKHFIAEKISRCLPVMVLSIDMLPLHICPKCFDSLNKSYTFLISVLKVDNQLKEEYLKNINDNSNKFVDNKQNESLTFNELENLAANGPIQCDNCQKTFKDMGLFDDHMDFSNCSPLNCNICNEKYDDHDQLLMHRLERHEMDNLPDNPCANLDDNTADFSQSLNDEADKVSLKNNLPILWRCDVCFLNFNSYEELSTHEHRVDEVTDVEQPNETVKTDEQTVDKESIKQKQQRFKLHLTQQQQKNIKYLQEIRMKELKRQEEIIQQEKIKQWQIIQQLEEIKRNEELKMKEKSKQKSVLLQGKVKQRQAIQKLDQAKRKEAKQIELNKQLKMFQQQEKNKQMQIIQQQLGEINRQEEMIQQGKNKLQMINQLKESPPEECDQQEKVEQEDAQLPKEVTQDVEQQQQNIQSDATEQPVENQNNETISEEIDEKMPIETTQIEVTNEVEGENKSPEDLELCEEILNTSNSSKKRKLNSNVDEVIENDEAKLDDSNVKKRCIPNRSNSDNNNCKNNYSPESPDKNCINNKNQQVNRSTEFHIPENIIVVNGDKTPLENNQLIYQNNSNVQKTTNKWNNKVFKIKLSENIRLENFSLEEHLKMKRKND